jgi:hypothetical protein
MRSVAEAQLSAATTTSSRASHALVASGYYTDDIDRAGGHIPILALAVYVVLGTGLAGVGPGRRG